MKDTEANEARAERAELAERWRLLGKKLRERSPRLFRAMTEIVTSYVLEEDEDDDRKIDSIYPTH